MPEILEIELYRRAVEPIVGRRISSVDADDDWFCKGETTPEMLRSILPGLTVGGLRRRGKLLLVDLTDGGAPAVVLGIRFGMTGRPVLDDLGTPFDLEYSSSAARPEWDRFAVSFEGDGRLRINDPRRLGGVELDPDEERLGPDAFTLTLGQLRRVLVSSAPVKAVLLDQSRIAGLGNMLVDEVLFRSGIDPARLAQELEPREVARLHRAIRAVLPELLGRGGSHTGRLAAAMRVRGARCPLDDTELERRTIGGRTTFSCPAHQR